VGTRQLVGLRVLASELAGAEHGGRVVGARRSVHRPGGEVAGLAALAAAAVTLEAAQLALAVEVAHAGEGTSATGALRLRRLPATIAAARPSGRFHAYAEHQTAGEARPSGRAAADGEPPLALDGEDAHAPAERRRRRRRHGCDRRASPRARQLARQGGCARRAPQEHGCPAQGAGRRAARTQRLLATRVPRRWA